MENPKTRAWTIPNTRKRLRSPPIHYFNECFKPGAYDDCRKGATATDGAAYNGTLLPPTAPEYGNYEPPYYHSLASSESSKKAALAPQKEKKINCCCCCCRFTFSTATVHSLSERRSPRVLIGYGLPAH